jgi:hypothetical protein
VPRDTREDGHRSGHRSMNGVTWFELFRERPAIVDGFSRLQRGEWGKPDGRVTRRASGITRPWRWWAGTGLNRRHQDFQSLTTKTRRMNKFRDLYTS